MCIRKSFWLLFSLFYLVSCAKNINVVKSWKESSQPEFKINKTLILFVTDHAPVQEAFEDAFVAKLQKAGKEAYAGYKTLLTKKEIDKELILQKVKELGVDSVIVTKAVNAKKKTMLEPSSPYDVPLSQYNIKLHEENIKKFGKDRPSGYIAMFDEVALKTTVYSAANQKPVWFLESNILTHDTFDKLVDSYLNIIVAQLHKDQLI